MLVSSGGNSLSAILKDTDFDLVMTGLEFQMMHFRIRSAVYCFCLENT